MSASSQDPRDKSAQRELQRVRESDLLGLRRRIEQEIARRGEQRDRGLRQRGGLVDAGAPAYRNPENSAETWSGRGTQPAWVREALKRGLTLHDLELRDDRPEPIDPDRRPI